MNQNMEFLRKQIEGMQREFSNAISDKNKIIE